MHPFVGALLLLASVNGVPDGRACLLPIERFTRPDSATYVIGRATADTISDGAYFLSSRGFDGAVRERQFASQEPHTVFGQIFELRAAHGPVASRFAGHDRVVVVWWTLGAQCQRWIPGQARARYTGELFLMGRPRAPSDWVDGIPTIDVEFADWVYAPGHGLGLPLPGGRVATRELTVGEYQELFTLLPAQGLSDTERIAVLWRLLSWGEEDPARWDFQPSGTALCQAWWSIGGSHGKVGMLLLAERVADRARTKCPRSVRE